MYGSNFIGKTSGDKEEELLSHWVPQPLLNYDYDYSFKAPSSLCLLIVISAMMMDITIASVCLTCKPPSSEYCPLMHYSPNQSSSNHQPRSSNTNQGSCNINQATVQCPPNEVPSNVLVNVLVSLPNVHLDELDRTIINFQKLLKHDYKTYFTALPTSVKGLWWRGCRSII